MYQQAETLLHVTDIFGHVSSCRVRWPSETNTEGHSKVFHMKQLHPICILICPSKHMANRHTLIHTDTLACMYTHSHRETDTHPHTHIYRHTHKHTHTHIHAHTHTHTHTH